MNESKCYPRDPQKFLTDSAWCDCATYAAHGRLTDNYYVQGRPPVDEPGELRRLTGIESQDYARVRGNLIRLGWRFENGFCYHRIIEETLKDMEEIRIAKINRTKAATEAAKLKRSDTSNVERNG